MNCLKPIKVYDDYVACGQCKNCKENIYKFSLNDLRKLCYYTKAQEKLQPKATKQNSYKKWWKKYVKIQKKIAILNNKIRKLEEKI